MFLLNKTENVTLLATKNVVEAFAGDAEVATTCDFHLAGSRLAV